MYQFLVANMDYDISVSNWVIQYLICHDLAFSLNCECYKTQFYKKRTVVLYHRGYYILPGPKKDQNCDYGGWWMVDGMISEKNT